MQEHDDKDILYYDDTLEDTSTILPSIFDTFYTSKQASEIFGVTRATINNWRNKGRLKGTRHPMSGVWVYNKNHVTEIIQGSEL